MNFDTSKTLGGIGAILMFIGIIPFISYYGILEFVGAILILVALYGLSGYYQNSGIFSNALYGIIAGIVGVILAVVITFTVILTTIRPFLMQLFPGWDGNWASLQNLTPDPNIFTSGNFDPSAFVPLAVGIVGILAILWIFAIIGTFLIRRSLKQVSDKSTVGLFGTSGLLLLIGAFLTIIGIGVILMWVAALLLAIAFFQLKPMRQMEQPPYYSPPPPPTTV